MDKNKKILIVMACLVLILIVVICVYFFVLSYYSSNENYQQDDIITKAENALNNARRAMEAHQEFSKSMPKKVFPEDSKIDKGAIKIIREPSFQEVAEKPKTQIEFLQEIANAKKKPVMELKESDLNKKINLYYQSDNLEKVSGSNVPDIGEDLKSPKKTMIAAPVSYKIFRNEKDWEEFINTHRVRKIEPDFKNGYVLILVSTSELPNGIFKADSFKKEKDGITVLYRVDPLEMAAENPNSTQNHYSAINIPKTEKIILKQIP